MQRPVNRIAFIGNYLPRQCGIATFTTDIAEAVANAYPKTTVFAVPMNDTAEGYAYPPRVRFEVADREVAAYRRAADFLNINNSDIVCLQHEFGIFGGPAGSHILALLNDLRAPVVTTLHTVLRDPDPNQRKVMDELIALSDRLVVMSQKGIGFLKDIYGVADEKIDFIHHGIPDVPFVDPNFYKDKFGVEGQIVLLTFGLLSPGKGIEYVIEALPAVLEHHPNLVYLVVGATHPHLKREQGESYRLSLQRLAQEKGVQSNLIFHNRFVTIEELCEFIGCADLYITPYLNERQITSGTLAYSVGAGKAVISTPYWYAEELLAEGRGLLIPFRDSAAIADRILYLLEHEAERHAMRRKAYQLGRDMIWKHVAQQYMASFERARDERLMHPRGVVKPRGKRPMELPDLDLTHLRTLTDDSGIIQHATFAVPNYDEGYATDDNARALTLSILIEEQGGESRAEARRLATRYLAFLSHAFNPETRRFRNFMTYRRDWKEEIGSEDCHGRALWALGTTAGRTRWSGLRGLAVRLFEEALPAVSGFKSPRAWAFSLLGIMEYLRRFYGHRAAADTRKLLSERLLSLFEHNHTDDWVWFEDRLTYSNAKLSHALILCGRWMEHDQMVDAGLRSLDWLMSIQRMDNDHFVPIGSNGFYVRGRDRARFDQQPVEAHASASACLEAYRMTGDERWKEDAYRAFGWFLGHNDLRIPLYDSSTGGCCDGLSPDRVNQNQGAESTLAFLLTLVEMRTAEHVIKSSDPQTEIEFPAGANPAPPATKEPTSQ